jgi:hypothetical protein
VASGTPEEKAGGLFPPGQKNVQFFFPPSFPGGKKRRKKGGPPFFPSKKRTVFFSSSFPGGFSFDLFLPHLCGRKEGVFLPLTTLLKLPPYVSLLYWSIKGGLWIVILKEATKKRGKEEGLYFGTLFSVPKKPIRVKAELYPSVPQ